MCGVVIRRKKLVTLLDGIRVASNALKYITRFTKI
jgi:hypothetical protein